MLLMTGFYGCKSSYKANKAPISKDVNKTSEQALFNTYSKSPDIISYKLKRHVHLPDIKGIDYLENYHGLQFINDDNTANIRLSGGIAEMDDYKEFDIIPSYGESIDEWLTFLPNPIMPHSFNDQKLSRLKELFKQQTPLSQSKKYAILEIDKSWIEQNIPQQEIIVRPDKVNIVTDPDDGTIYQYVFEFFRENNPIEKHIISFEDYTKHNGIKYPKTIVRTTYLRELNDERSNELQEQIVQNIELIEIYNQNKSDCKNFEDEAQKKYCREKWAKSIKALEIINEMMIDRVSTLVYEIEIEDIRLK